VKVGDGAQQGTGVGPIQNKKQFERVCELIQDAKDQGYQFLTGGDVDPSGTGYYVPITILDNPPEDARIVAEEQFGPVMPLMKFSTTEEVIARANNSDYGLAGAVWTGDTDKGVEVAEQLETGTVWVNEYLHLSPFAPFGGQGVEAQRFLDAPAQAFGVEVLEKEAVAAVGGGIVLGHGVVEAAGVVGDRQAAVFRRDHLRQAAGLER